MNDRVELRRYPYPYQAALAICSDLDETVDWETYVEISRFMNTEEHTRMGEGVGLEIGNTIYFDMASDELSYWNLGTEQQEQCRALIRSGHIDCVHSFGDLAKTREDAKRALNELSEHQCRLRVWVDHAQAPTNMGADIMEGHGDDSQHPAYHADLLTNYGMEYFWLGRVTSQLGQAVAYRVSSQWDPRTIVDSARRILKDLVKKLLSGYPGSRFGMHRGNRLTRRKLLRDGQTVTEFMRCDPHPNGISAGDNAVGMAEVLSSKNLESFLAARGVSIIYTHLGKRLADGDRFPLATVEAFRRLKAFSRDRGLLVTTTQKLLDYEKCYEAAASRQLVIANGRLELDSTKLGKLAGLTFYTGVGDLSLYVDGRPFSGLVRNAKDETGRQSYSIPWQELRWPLA